MGLETVALAGLALSAVGTGASIYGQVQQSEGSKKAEDLKQRQMELNQQREQRQIFRKAQQQRAVAVANATANGAEKSSALPGGIAQGVSDSGFNSVAARENFSIGQGLFEANKQLSEGKAISSIGSSVSDFGGKIIQNQAAIHRIKTTLFEGEDMKYGKGWDATATPTEDHNYFW